MPSLKGALGITEFQVLLVSQQLALNPSLKNMEPFGPNIHEGDLLEFVPESHSRWGAENQKLHPKNEKGVEVPS